MIKKIPLLLGLFLFTSTMMTGAVIADDLKVLKVAENIYAMIGETTQRSSENLGNNANFGAIITNAGVVLVDPGGSLNGAKHIEKTVRQFSDKPIIKVINTGGQDHRWIGNDYFKQQGAEIIASTTAVEDQQERSNLQFEIMTNLIGADLFEGTKAVFADKTFDETLILNIDGTRIELYATAGSHTQGDVYVWLPDTKTMFTSDLVYTNRILGIAEYSTFSNWIPAFEKMATFNPVVAVPGHGMPGPLSLMKSDTYDYLVNLRDKVTAVIESGGEIADATVVDQQKFKYLENFDQLSRRNAQQVFIQLEFEL